MFTAPDIRNRIKKSPFEPFRIVTTSGQTFDVVHPDLVMVGTRDVVVGHPSRRDPSIHDGVTQIAMLHITMLENLPTTAGPHPDTGSNGAG